MSNNAQSTPIQANNRINSIPASEKTPEQRKIELTDWLARPASAKELPEPLSGTLAKMVDLLAGQTVSFGGQNLLVVPEREDWRAYVSQKGANKGRTIHSALGYREGNYLVGKPVDGYQLFVSVGMAFVPAK